MSESTASEQIRLDIIKKVNYDTAAAKLAIDWVGDSYLKSELFADSFDRVFQFAIPDDVLSLHPLVGISPDSL